MHIIIMDVILCSFSAEVMTQAVWVSFKKLELHKLAERVASTIAHNRADSIVKKY